MDKNYPVTLLLSKEEYDGMKQVVAAYYGDPAKSVGAFGIASYLYNIVCDLLIRGKAERDGFVR